MKRENERKRIANEIEWFESLLKTLEKGDLETGRLSVEAAIKVLRKQALNKEN